MLQGTNFTFQFVDATIDVYRNRVGIEDMAVMLCENKQSLVRSVHKSKKRDFAPHTINQAFKKNLSPESNIALFKLHIVPIEAMAYH